MRRPITVLAACWLFCMMLVGACGTGPDEAADPLTIVATTSIIGDVVANVADGDASVAVLVPLDADPQDFQPSARQVAAIQNADLVVANGLQLEGGLEDVLTSAADDGGNVLMLAPLLEPRPLATSSGDSADAALDPHVWLDPLRMATAAGLIAHELEAIAPGNGWNERAADYAEQLTDADVEIRRILDAIPVADRKLVTNHDALGYFADRYGFMVIGVVIPGGSTLADPSSAALADLVAVIRQERVTTIFAETTEPTTVAEAVAGEAGRDVAVVELYTGSLGAAGSGAETLITMLLHNAQRIADGLS